MASISLTYTLSNGSTADADQVMENFNDIVDGTSDGTKDFSINALTAAGTASLNGAVNLGNATSDDITITGRIASDIDPKTAATYTLGDATQTWRSLSLDNTSTDGGAIYFDAGTTKFIKSDASGADLDVSGFTAVDLNALNLKGTGDIAPSAAASEDVGTTSLPYRAVYLDNTSTDGGSIYFDAGSTKSIKCNAAGTALGFNGFTQLETDANFVYYLTANADTHQLKWTQSGFTNSFAAIRVTDQSDFRQKIEFLNEVSQTDSAPVVQFSIGPGSGQIEIPRTNATLKVGTPATANVLEVYDQRNIDDAPVVISKSDTSTTGQDFIAFFRSGDRNTLEGTIRTDGSGNLVIDNTSDPRLKKNVVKMNKGLSVVNALDASEFDWDESRGGGKGRGFLADKVEEHVPEAVGRVTVRGETIKTVSMISLIPFLWSAVQSLSEKVTILEQRGRS